MTIEQLKENLIDTANGYLASKDLERAQSCVKMYVALCDSELRSSFGRVPFGLESGAAMPSGLAPKEHANDNSIASGVPTAGEAQSPGG